MALRKFLFQAAEGYMEEQQPTDSINLGALGVAGDITLSGGGKVTGSAAPVGATDLTNKAYVDQLVVTGTMIKEALFCTHGLSNTQGIRALEVLYFLAQPVAGDTVIFKNASLTRTYTFVANIGAEATATDVSVQSSALTALQRLILRANADAGNTQWDLYENTNNERLTPSAPSGTVACVVERTTAAGLSASRIYGVFTTATDAKVVRFQTGGVADLDYMRVAAITMPAADPAEGNFGLRRQVVALVDGEMHYALGEDVIWAWDADAVQWNVFSGPGAIPDATSGSGGGLKGKITVDSDFGLLVTAGVLKINADSNGGLKYTGAGPKQLSLSLQTSNPALAITGNLLDVKYQTAKGLDSDASGLLVKVDGTTIGFTGGGALQTLAAAEATRVENSINVDAAVTAGDPVYLTATGARVSKADTGTDAEARVIGVARTTQASVGSPTEVVEVGYCAGVLSGATPGTPYYLATGGGLSTATPGSGKRVIQVGVAVTASDLMVRIIDYGKKA